MYCRYCGAEMQDEEVVCSACGAENAMPAQPVQPEEPRKAMNWKAVVAAVCCAVVVFGLVAVVLSGMNAPELPVETIRTKESYTGTDEEVLAALDTVVAKAGRFELTNRELQIAYWTALYDFVEYYGDYAAYWIDFTQPLDQQYFDTEKTTTWQQYFLETALKTWRRYEVLVAMSEAENIPMSQELTDYFAGLPKQMESALAQYGFESIEDMVVHDYGVGGNYATYETFMKLYHYSNEHYARLQERQSVTEAEIEAYYTANEDAFVSAGCAKEDGSVVNVRHILIAPGEDSDKPYTDDMWAAAEIKAQQLLDTWLQGKADEEAFAALAKTNSDCPSAAQGGLISDITKGQMVQEFEDWCMAEHEYGDYGIVKTSYGYHLMFYIDGTPLWYSSAKSGVVATKLNDLLKTEEEKYPLTVSYSKILLGEAKLGE